MTPGERYKLRKPLLALQTPTGILGINTQKIQAGEIVTIHGKELDHERIVDVEWDGKIWMMFVAELREHADLVTAAP